MSIQRYSQLMIIDAQTNLPTLALKGDFAYCADTGLSFLFDGTYWNSSAKVQLNKTTAAVNAKNTGTTLLYTLEGSSLNFYPTQVIPRVNGVGVSGVTTGPTISIGTNGSSYNNIASTSLMTTLTTALTAGNNVPSNTSFSPALAGGTAIYANVTVGAVATNYTLLYDIIGFYDA